MVFTLIIRQYYDPNVRIEAIEMKRVDDFNFLGLQLNYNLKWNKHINYVSFKMSKNHRLIAKAKISLLHFNTESYLQYSGMSTRKMSLKIVYVPYRLPRLAKPAEHISWGFGGSVSPQNFLAC